MNQKLGSHLTVLDKIIQLQDSLSSKEQVYWAQEISKHDLSGHKALLELLINRLVIQKLNTSSLDGIVFEILTKSHFRIIKDGIQQYFPGGIVQLNQFNNVNYQDLQSLLIQQKFQEADRLTQVKLCELVGLNKNNKRDWLYFTDIPLIPSDDLSVIDLLWRVYSRDKFGFSKQRQIWLSSNCDWEKLWINIGWKSKGIARRYPCEFIWNLNAPQGHLPLFNQLRGVQVLSALFNHILWYDS